MFYFSSIQHSCWLLVRTSFALRYLFSAAFWVIISSKCTLYLPNVIFSQFSVLAHFQYKFYWPTMSDPQSWARRTARTGKTTVTPSNNVIENKVRCFQALAAILSARKICHIRFCIQFPINSKKGPRLCASRSSGILQWIQNINKVT